MNPKIILWYYGKLQYFMLGDKKYKKNVKYLYEYDTVFIDKLEDLPEYLPELNTLHIKHNEFKAIKKFLKCPKLVELDLAYNSIRGIYSFNLPNLTVLRLNNN